MRANMMRAIATSIAACAVVAGLQAQAGATSQVELALRYVHAQEQVMQSDATEADVDAMLAMVTEGFVYHHPAFDARVAGKAAAREGMLSHLGQTSDPEIRVSQISEHGDIVTIATRTRFRTASGEAIDRSGTWVLQFRDGLIALRADF